MVMTVPAKPLLRIGDAPQTCRDPTTFASGMPPNHSRRDHVRIRERPELADCEVPGRPSAGDTS
jgi:hypothetical protein